MTRIKSMATAALAVVGIALSTAAAMADVPAVATSAVNVRSGPGTGYGVIGQLSAGQNVAILQQQGSWCYVQAHVTGWSSCSYLAAGGGGGGGGATPEVPFNFGVTVGPGGPSFSFGIGDAPPPAPPVPVASRVCFYKNANFGGAEWCVNSGTNINNINFGGWNDNISSLRVFGGASAQVCTNVNYGGACTLYNSNRPNLNMVYNNQISSVKIF